MYIIGILGASGHASCQSSLPQRWTHYWPINCGKYAILAGSVGGSPQWSWWGERGSDSGLWWKGYAGLWLHSPTTNTLLPSTSLSVHFSLHELACNLLRQGLFKYTCHIYCTNSLGGNWVLGRNNVCKKNTNDCLLHADTTFSLCPSWRKSRAVQ